MYCYLYSTVRLILKVLLVVGGSSTLHCARLFLHLPTGQRRVQEYHSAKLCNFLPKRQCVPVTKEEMVLIPQKGIETQRVNIPDMF